MNKSFLFAGLALCLMSSCCQEFDVDNLAESQVDSRTLSCLDMLEFETRSDFDHAVLNVEYYVDSIKKNFRFISLYDEYERAWDLSDEYYESEEKYQEFKKMFPGLYFPEYKDDYSFFLPVRNEAVAKLLNNKGYVKIGNKVVDITDIKTPEDLLELGLLAPDDAITYSVDHNTEFENNIPEQADGDRKFWLNTYAGNFVRMEANFRKKSAFGRWRNYKSKTTLVGSLYYASGVVHFPITSSQDKKGPHVYEAFPGGVGAYYPCHGTFTIDYQGLGKFKFKVNKQKPD